MNFMDRSYPLFELFPFVCFTDFIFTFFKSISNVCSILCLMEFSALGSPVFIFWPLLCCCGFVGIFMFIICNTI